jgi:hypothetical protein
VGGSVFWAERGRMLFVTIRVEEWDAEGMGMTAWRAMERWMRRDEEREGGLGLYRWIWLVVWWHGVQLMFGCRITITV